MSEKSTGSYRVLRNEPKMGIGDWTGDLVANEYLTVGVRGFTEETAAVLLEGGLIERSDADPKADPPAPTPHPEAADG